MNPQHCVPRPLTSQQRLRYALNINLRTRHCCHGSDLGGVCAGKVKPKYRSRINLAVEELRNVMLDDWLHRDGGQVVSHREEKVTDVMHALGALALELLCSLHKGTGEEAEDPSPLFPEKTRVIGILKERLIAEGLLPHISDAKDDHLHDTISVVQSEIYDTTEPVDVGHSSPESQTRTISSEKSSDITVEAKHHAALMPQTPNNRGTHHMRRRSQTRLAKSEVGDGDGSKPLVQRASSDTECTNDPPIPPSGASNSSSTTSTTQSQSYFDVDVVSSNKESPNTEYGDTISRDDIKENTVPNYQEESPSTRRENLLRKGAVASDSEARISGTTPSPGEVDEGSSSIQRENAAAVASQRQCLTDDEDIGESPRSHGPRRLFNPRRASVSSSVLTPQRERPFADLSDCPALPKHLQTMEFGPWPTGDDSKHPVRRILEKMLQSPVSKRDRGPGYVYCWGDNLTGSGHLKIGFTSVDHGILKEDPASAVGKIQRGQGPTGVTKRIQHFIKECRGGGCDESWSLEYYGAMLCGVGRVEKLIHQTLHLQRRKVLQCRKRDCIKTRNAATEEWGDTSKRYGQKGGHNEWFEVTVEDAAPVIEVWRVFSGCKPYDEHGNLKSYWIKWVEEELNGPSKGQGAYWQRGPVDTISWLHDRLKCAVDRCLAEEQGKEPLNEGGGSDRQKNRI